VNKNNALIIHFPIMLEALVPEYLRPLARLLNPGLHEQSENRFTPDNLVLDSAGVKTFLSQSVQFGEQFKKPTDMAYLGASGIDDFYSDTSLSLRWQITTYDQEKNEHGPRGDYLKAQQLLILEYVFEEKMAELDSISTDIGTTWKELDSSLGIDRDDEEIIALDRDSDFRISAAINWERLLWAFSLFLPQNAFLLLYDQQIADELEETGVVWEKSEPELYWDNFPLNGEILRGTLKTKQTRTYLGRIRRDINFLKIA
jgi:hypothetical protein